MTTNSFKFKWLLVPLILITLGVGNALGDVKLEFTTGTSDGTQAITDATRAQWMTSATKDLCTLASLSNAYYYYSKATQYGGPRGIRIGKSSAAGNATFNIATASQINSTTIVVEASRYASDKACDLSIQVNGGSALTAQALSDDVTREYTFTFSNTKVTSVRINTTKYAYIKSITIKTAATCSADPTVGAASLNGSVSLTGATVQCASGVTNIGGAGCSLTSYGFVVGTSSNPTIGGGGVTQHEVGTSIAVSTGFEKALTLAAGTYYVRPYATNGHGTGYGTQYTLVIPSLSSIAITTAPARTAYLQGETFDPTGAVVTATYSNSTTADVTESVTWSPTTLSSTGSQTMTAIYSGKTATTTVTVYSVTLQAKDEDGNDISAGGPGAPSFNAATRGISPAADAANYGWWKWEVTNATLGSAITTKNNTISSPTGDVVITAKYRNPRTVTWMVNGVEWTPSESGGTDGTAVVKYGSAWSTLTLPTDPTTSDGCGDKFVGWVATPISGKQADDTGLDLMTSANKSDKTGAGHNVNDNITFHAVFADYEN